MHPGALATDVLNLSFAVKFFHLIRSPAIRFQSVPFPWPAFSHYYYHPHLFYFQFAVPAFALTSAAPLLFHIIVLTSVRRLHYLHHCLLLDFLPRIFGLLLFLHYPRLSFRLPLLLGLPNASLHLLSALAFLHAFLHFFI